MMETILWEVQYSSLPKTIHYCKKCAAKTEHLSSGLFRVNAQQKSLDVWLVYRCIHCRTTWNLAIYSRVAPRSIPRHLLDGFIHNDEALAQRYAMDTDLLKRNGANTGEPPYSVTGEAVDFSREVRIKIVSACAAGIRLDKILRKKLALSRKDFDAMVDGGIIRLENGGEIYKRRLHKEAVVLIAIPRQKDILGITCS